MFLLTYLLISVRSRSIIFLNRLRSSSTFLHLSSNHPFRLVFGLVPSMVPAALFIASLLTVQEHSTSSRCSIVSSRLFIWSWYVCFWTGSRTFPISHFVVDVVSFYVLGIRSITLARPLVPRSTLVLIGHGRVFLNNYFVFFHMTEPILTSSVIQVEKC